MTNRLPAAGNTPCAYCGARAIHMDHVVPRSLVRQRGGGSPAYLLVRVPCCGPCNWRKLTRRLVPPSWEHLILALQEAFPGRPWRVWNGDPMAAAFREVHV